jgi:hypothetical protein
MEPRPALTSRLPYTTWSADTATPSCAMMWTRSQKRGPETRNGVSPARVFFQDERRSPRPIGSVAATALSTAQRRPPPAVRTDRRRAGIVAHRAGGIAHVNHRHHCESNRGLPDPIPIRVRRRHGARRLAGDRVEEERAGTPRAGTFEFHNCRVGELLGQEVVAAPDSNRPVCTQERERLPIAPAR